MIPLQFVFVALFGAGDDGVETRWVAHDVILDDGLAGAVLVLSAFAVAPPDKSGFGAAFFAGYSST